MKETSTLLQTQVVINAPRDDVRDWFLSLQTHPESYRFDSHNGFAFTKGTFGRPDSEFYTIERFFGIRLKLRFRITDVMRYDFQVEGRRPLVGSWCKFSLKAQSPERTILSLDVGTHNRIHAAFLKLTMLHNAVQHQIDAEVQNIKLNIESTFSKGA